MLSPDGMDSHLSGQAFNHMFCVGCQELGVLPLITPAGRLHSDTWCKPLLRPCGSWDVSPHVVGKFCMAEEELGPEWCLNMEWWWC